MAEIIELETDHTIAANLSSIGTEYFNTMERGGFPIVGTVDPISKLLVLVIDESVQQELMNFVNALNLRNKK